MSGIAIRIVGGIIGVFISGKIYDNYYNQKKENNQKTNISFIDYYNHKYDEKFNFKFKLVENKLDENKLDENKLDENKLDENKLDENKLDENKLDDEYKETTFINDALYDNSYYDCYVIIGR